VATLAQIRDGVKTVLETAIAGLQVHPRFDSIGSLPAVVIVPADAGYLHVMNQSHMVWELDLLVLTSKAINSLGQYDLDELIDIAGARSIPAALYGEDLELPGTQAHVATMSRYGGEFEAAAIDHIGAALRVVVHTTGA